LLLRTQYSRWIPLTFLVDTEADLTYLSTFVADILGIYYETDRTATLTTRGGIVKDGAYLSQLTFAFEVFPDLQFQTTAWFARASSLQARGQGELPLLAGSDLLRHFKLMIDAQPTSREPVGFFQL